MIKKKFNYKISGVGKAVVTFFVSVGILIGAHASVKAHYSDYTNLLDQKFVASQVNCIESYRSTLGRRLKHNGDEPIYISFSKDFTEEKKQEVLKSLDYIFGVVSKIDERYRYQIVENADDLKYFGKTVINFKFEDLENGTSGLCFYDWVDPLSFVSLKGAMNEKLTITFDVFYRDNAHKHFSYLIKHEVLHAFGFDDVYTRDPIHHNTLMHAFMAEFIHTEIFTPNDIRLLYTIYHKPYTSKQHMQQEIAEFNKKIEEYSKKFYTHHLEGLQKEHIRELKVWDIAVGDKAEKMAKIVPMGENVDVAFKTTVNDTNVKYIHCKVDGDKYKIATFSGDGQKISSCEGSAYHINGAIYLQSVELKDFIRNDNTVGDYCFVRRNNGEYFLESLSGDSLCPVQFTYKADPELVK